MNSQLPASKLEQDGRSAPEEAWRELRNGLVALEPEPEPEVELVRVTGSRQVKQLRAWLDGRFTIRTARASSGSSGRRHMAEDVRTTAAQAAEWRENGWRAS